MKESYIEGPASHDGPESCVGVRKGAGEVLTPGSKARSCTTALRIWILANSCRTALMLSLPALPPGGPEGRNRAVLIEMLDTKWAEELRQASAEVYSGGLYWFTASELFTAEKPNPTGKVTGSLFLQKPEIVLNRVWVTSARDAVSLSN